MADLDTLDLDACTSDELGRTAAAVQTEIDRLTVLRDRIAGTLWRRAVVGAGAGREQAAVLRSTRDLGHRLGLAPSQAKRAADRGRPSRPARSSPWRGRALHRTTTRPPRTRSPASATTRGHQVVTCGRTRSRSSAGPSTRSPRTPGPGAGHADRCRCDPPRWRARPDGPASARQARPAAANRAEQRRHARRTVSVCQIEDGMLATTGQLSGVDAETARTRHRRVLHTPAPRARAGTDP